VYFELTGSAGRAIATDQGTGGAAAWTAHDAEPE
jgi:hypothetical protein